jgi:hypothetical protein
LTKCNYGYNNFTQLGGFYGWLKNGGRCPLNKYRAEVVYYNTKMVRIKGPVMQMPVMEYGAVGRTLC